MNEMAGSAKVPNQRLGEQGERVGPECRDCGEPLGAGYLCDDCDEIEIHD